MFILDKFVPIPVKTRNIRARIFQQRSITYLIQKKWLTTTRFKQISGVVYFKVQIILARKQEVPVFKIKVVTLILLNF